MGLSWLDVLVGFVGDEAVYGCFGEGVFVGEFLDADVFVFAAAAEFADGFWRDGAVGSLRVFPVLGEGDELEVVDAAVCGVVVFVVDFECVV